MKRFAYLLPVLLLWGCGEATLPPITPVDVHPVSGQITYAGKPAAGVKVFFMPIDAPSVPRIPANPHGETDASGKFTITTFKDGDGAAEGSYQIVLLWDKTGTSGGVDEDNAVETDTDSNDRLLGWYDATHSELQYRVVPGNNVIPPLNLPAKTQRPPFSQGVPGRN